MAGGRRQISCLGWTAKSSWGLGTAGAEMIQSNRLDIATAEQGQKLLVNGEESTRLGLYPYFVVGKDRGKADRCWCNGRRREAAVVGI